jgi:hypothetical protein
MHNTEDRGTDCDSGSKQQDGGDCKSGRFQQLTANLQ